MPIQILPTSFFGNPEPQGSINGNIARLAVEAGEALTKRVEAQAIQTEASIKAPILGKLYSSSLQALASGDASGLAGLSQASALAGGNPLLESMNKDAFGLGVHVLTNAQNTALLTERLKSAQDLQTERLKSAADLAVYKTIAGNQARNETQDEIEYRQQVAEHNKQVDAITKDNEKAQKDYQAAHEAWVASGSPADIPEPVKPTLKQPPTPPVHPSRAALPTLPSAGGTGPETSLGGIPIAGPKSISLTDVSTPGTVRQPDGTIAPEPATPITPVARATPVSPQVTPVEPPMPSGAAPVPTGTPVAAPGIPVTIPGQQPVIGATPQILNQATYQSPDVTELLKDNGLPLNKPIAVSVQPNGDRVMSAPGLKKDVTIPKATFDQVFAPFTSGQAQVTQQSAQPVAQPQAQPAVTGKGVELKFGEGTLVVPKSLVDESQKQQQDTSTITQYKIGDVTRTVKPVSEGGTGKEHGIEGEMDRLRKQPLLTTIQQFIGNDQAPQNPEIVQFWDKYLTNGGSIQVVPLEKKKGDKEAPAYALMGREKDGTRERFAYKDQSPEQTTLTPDEAAQIKVISEKFPSSGIKYIPPSTPKVQAPTKFDDPSAQQAYDNLKTTAKQEGWSAEKFVSESQKIDKTGQKVLDLPKGYTPLSSTSTKGVDNTEKIKSLKQESVRLLSEVDSYKAMGLPEANIASQVNARQNRISDIRKQLRALGVNPND